MTTTNPTNRLSATPTSGCLPEKDALQFWDLFQEARLSANRITNHFPDITDCNQLHSEYSSTQGQLGQIRLPLLTALMYTYWDHAPTGPSAFDLTKERLSNPLREVCRMECAEWGKARLNAPVDKTFYVVDDTPTGSIVAYHSMKTFYKVLGMERTPAEALVRIGIEIPAIARITILPFRGVLVYDGMMYGTQPERVSASKACTLRKRYAEAQRRGNAITGFHVDTNMSVGTPTRIASRTISDLSEHEKKQVNFMKAARKVDNTMVFRRFGYTEADNPNHTVSIMNGGVFCGVFTSSNLVPSAKEVLCELVKLVQSSNALPKIIKVDDDATANCVNEVTKHAGVHTTLYPSPSVEERELRSYLPDPVLEDLKSKRMNFS